MKRKASLVDDSDDEDTKVRKLPTSDNYSFVVGSSSITQEQQQQISKLEDTGQISISGADFASTTHLICATNDQDSCRRTLKVLFAIAKGAYLLNMKWITNSMEMGYIVEEDEYELTQKQCPGAKKARKHKQEDKPSLLIGMKIFITGSTKMEHDVLVQLVEAMGAKNVSAYKDCDVCVLGEEHDFRPTKLDKPIVNEKWLTDTVYFYTKKPFDDYAIKIEPLNVVPDIKPTNVSHEEEKDAFIVNGKRYEKENIVATLRLVARNPDQKRLHSTLLIPILNTQKVTILGRAESKCDFYVNDRRPQVVSRMHAKIFFDGEKYSIEDTSTNGTFVNSIRIRKANLNNGDVIAFGHVDANVAQGTKVQVKSACCYVFETYTQTNETLVPAKKYEALMRQEIDKIKNEHQREYKKLQDKLNAELKEKESKYEIRSACNWVVLDTNCVIDHGTDEYLIGNIKTSPLELLMKRKDTIIVIPWVMICELDGLKKSNEPLVAMSARKATKFLDDYQSKNGNVLRVPSIVFQKPNEELSLSDGGLSNTVPDDRILNCCLYFQKQVVNKSIQKLYLLTGDKNLRVKAAVNSCNPMSLQNYLNK